MVPAGNAVELDTLGLKYNLRHEDVRSVKWALLNLLGNRRLREDFWALKNVTFAIPTGETWGVIGVNGSGKSTLLKLITGILRPNKGTISVNGSVSALLELGAGFQPDLTGRENIFLNGSLIGLPKRVIQEKIEDIIDFSEIRPFIDTPVKHYSSGMYMRLGFSIAVNVDPDILLIDEIFAVGDLRFQEKCMDRVNDFKAKGKTIILVSHDMNSIRALCDKVVWLHQGAKMRSGTTEEIIDYYKNFLHDQDDEAVNLQQIDQSKQRWGTGTIAIEKVIFTDKHGKQTINFRTGDPFCCTINFTTSKKVTQPVFGIAIHRNDGIHISGPNTKLHDYTIESASGTGEITYKLDQLPLLPGKYLLSAVVYDSSCVVPYDHWDKAFPFNVVAESSRELYGIIEIGGSWHIQSGAGDKT